MKKLFYPLMLATAFVATSCTNTEDTNTTVDPSGKTPISFVGENNTAPITRAGFVEGATQIAMHIRSTKATDTTRKTIRETRTLATAAVDTEKKTTSVSSIDQNSAYYRYWDDAYGRDAQLSIFAIAVPGKTYTDATLESKLKSVSEGKVWDDAALDETVSWTVSTAQTGDKINNEDLVYSNNIQADGTLGKGGVKSSNSSVTDGELKFRLTSTSENPDPNGPGKFDEGHLIFNHALSRITINLNRDLTAGFTASSPFAFGSGNVSILGVPTSGSLNLETGKWTPSTTSTGITSMACTKDATTGNYTLQAQVIPGFVIKADDDNSVLQFTIDGNLYNVSHKVLFDVLKGKPNIAESTSTTITMEQGHNYNLTINVGKTKITNVSATLEPWKPVDADDKSMDNSRNLVTIYKNTSNDATANNSFTLYRAVVNSTTPENNWAGNYKESVTPKEENGVLTTTWFYENDNSFYHFRSVKTGTVVVGAEKDDIVDYFVVYSGKQDSEHDYRWGAPFKKGVSSPFTYDSGEGYAAYISPAIGSTKSPLNFTEFHVMSNINVIVRTTTGTNAVVLEDASKSPTEQCVVTIKNFCADGIVNMGNGLVTPTGSATASATLTAPAPGIETKKINSVDYKQTKAFSYTVVPQAVGNTVELTIKTPDGNVYTIKDLSKMTVSGSEIKVWEPNHEYTYIFTLTKTGLVNVTCTVEGWKEVKAEEKTITLEN